MKTIRYAVVGAGWITQEAFLPGIAQAANSEVSVLVSGSPETARRLAGFHGIPHVTGYDGFDAMLAADLCDAVYVALPNSMHADYAIRAARAGKHVMVEKPLAISVAEAEAMISAAAEAGVWLMTAYRLHCEPGTADLMARIAAGEIGEPKLFSSIFSFLLPEGNHRLSAGHWGGPLQDVGVYCLNAARHVFGAEPVEAVAVKSHGTDPRFAEVEESIAVTLTFPEGRIAQFLASFGADAVDSYTVVGTEGSLTLNPGFRFDLAQRLLAVKADEFVTVDHPQVDHFAGQAAYFSDCILEGRRPGPDGEEGLADMHALLAIEQAAKTGLPQRIGAPVLPFRRGTGMARRLPVTDRRLVL
ncbi:Gfo/Idh/MocA family protein [Mangrovicoccus sp. HB161399]|uniref:Gfo/Idh/MocA family protein n=1 Tax=Mangrovicoccus sp. HB161399 TaxID=2720392 RepID=UPI001556A2DF|nr:Gfo/Idh/MocA family oxidoreductase [Mangrovicoccus sp. HB161399]